MTKHQLSQWVHPSECVLQFAILQDLLERVTFFRSQCRSPFGPFSIVNVVVVSNYIEVSTNDEVFFDVERIQVMLKCAVPLIYAIT